MGKRGPVPTPSAVLRKRGSWRANRNPAEPRPDPGRPTMPSWLNAEARRVWRYLCPLLHGMGTLTKVDRDTLAAYCTAFARWRECERFMDQNGLVMPRRDSKGTVIGAMPVPHAGLAQSYLKSLVRLGSELGLTPAARARMVAHLPIETPDAEAPAGKARYFAAS